MKRLALVVTAAGTAVALFATGTAYADTVTHAGHDGTAETAIHADDPNDRVSRTFDVLVGTVASATSATLRIYARADSCAGSGATQRITVNRATLTEIDPCAVFPTSGFGWATFAVPLSLFPPDWGGHTVSVEDVALGSSRGAYYAIDTDSFMWGNAEEWNLGLRTPYRGALMWELAFDGNTPALAMPPWSMDYDLVTVGASVTSSRTVTSSGTAPTPAISTVAVTGPNAADFAVTTDTCTGAVLPYGATCTVKVTFTPSALGSRGATLTVSGGAASVTADLSGEGRNFVPPATTIATPDGSTLMPGDTVTGTVTDDVGVEAAYVRFTPEIAAVGVVTVAAALSCDPTGTSCTWSAPVLLRPPGRYTVTAFGLDVQENAEPPGPGIAVLVV